jgi:hypothetical protein
MAGKAFGVVARKQQKTGEDCRTVRFEECYLQQILRDFTLPPRNTQNLAPLGY